jgi:hypothetical protein
MNVHVDIGRLVLDGVTLTPRERRALTGALHSELTRLITVYGVAAQQGAASDRVGAPSLPMSQPVDPARMGTDLARALYGTFGNPVEAE